MEQQTAVEWLFRQMTSTWYDTNCGKTILKQAKAYDPFAVVNKTPDDLKKHVTKETELWSGLIRELGIKVE